MSHPPGWYAIPGDASGAREWWNGTTWTGEYWKPPTVPESAQFSLDREQGADRKPTAARTLGIDRRLLAVLTIALLAFAYTQYRSWEHQKLIAYQESTFVEFEPREPGQFLLGGSLSETEDLAAAYRPRPDDSGTYVESGQDLAQMFGIELTWGDASAGDPCFPPEVRLAHVLASYCDQDPYTIRFNRDASAMPRHLHEEELINTVKHELAHFIIDARCGTPDPPAARGQFEGVTNSYAVLYLDAGRDDLSRSKDIGFAEYEMTPATDAAAARIHAGDCG